MGISGVWSLKIFGVVIRVFCILSSYKFVNIFLHWIVQVKLILNHICKMNTYTFLWQTSQTSDEV